MDVFGGHFSGAHNSLDLHCAITYRGIVRLSNRFTLWNKIDNYRRLVTNELWFYHHDQSLAPLQGKLGTETLVLEAFLVIDCASTVWASS